MVISELDFSSLDPTEERKKELIPLIDEIMLKFDGMTASEILWLVNKLRFGTVLGASRFNKLEYLEYMSRMGEIINRSYSVQTKSEKEALAQMEQRKVL